MPDRPRDTPMHGVHVVHGEVPEGVVPPSTSMRPVEPAADVSALRERLADALTQWTLTAVTGGIRSSPVHPATLENLHMDSLARADALMPVVQAALAEQTQRAEQARTLVDALIATMSGDEDPAVTLRVVRRTLPRILAALDRPEGTQRDTEIRWEIGKGGLR